MPTEVLVMCGACGRPQPAGRGPCVACGAVLPEAPVPGPAAPPTPFLEVDLGGGRTLLGVGGRLSFRPDAGASPLVVEMGSVEDAQLRQQPLYAALVLAGLLAAGCAAVASLRPLAFVLLLLGAGATAFWRRYVLELRLRNGPPVHWPLGLVRRGSRREAHIQLVWIRLIVALRPKAPRPGVPSA